MEVVLRTEMVSSSPRLHSLLRTHLVSCTQLSCTDCIVSTCQPSHFQDCVARCMSPCVRFKLHYEDSRKRLIEVSGRQAMDERVSQECLKVSEEPEFAKCRDAVVEEFVGKVSSFEVDIESWQID